MRRLTRRLTLMLAATSVFGVHLALGQPSADPRVADLVQARKLRVGIGLGTPALAIKDPATGEARGPSLDLGRALAARIGVELQPVYYPRPGAVLEGLRSNEWDVTFLVADPSRAAEADFSPPYMTSDFTFMVAAPSPIRSVADADRAGIRISVPRGDASDLRLTRMLKHAELIRADSIAAASDLVRTGQVNAYAGPRFTLMAEAARQPGSRVLDDHFAVISNVGMVPKGNAQRLAYITEFLEEAKASGLVQQAIDRIALRGVQVAPAAKQ